MTDLATLGLAVDSRPVVDASKDLDRIREAAARAEKQTDSFGKRVEDAGKRAAAANDNAARSADRLTRSVTATSAAFRALRTVVAPLLALFSLGAMARYGDEWSTLEWRVQNATGSLANARATLEDLGRVARASWSPIEQVAEGFLRQEASLSALGYTTKQQIDLLEALNSAILISGLRGQRAQMVSDAWAKATARGSLRGDELNTVLLNSSRLSELLADKMGVSVNELRKLGEAGKITTDVMFGITDQLAQLRKEMEGDATLAGGFTLLRNEMLMFFGMLDKATGFTSSLGNVLVIVADGFAALRRALVFVTSNLDQFAEAAGIAGVTLSLVFGRAALSVLAVSFGWFVGGVLSGLTAIKAAVIANPLGAFATVIMVAVTAAYYFRDEIQKAIGVDVVGIAKTAANLVIGSFVAAYEDIKFVWNNFPTIMSAAITGAVNFVIRGVNKMVNSAIDGINKLISGLNSLASFFGADKAAQVFGFSGKISEIDPWGGISEMDNTAAADLSAAAGARNAAVQAALARDYIGELGATFKTSEQAAADFGSAVAAANQSLENTGGDGGAADKAAKAVKDVADAANDAAQAALDFGRDIVKGFVSDLRSGLEQGKGFWRSFGDAALNALNKIIDKILNDLIDAIFQIQSAGGGGIFGAIFGGIGKLLGFSAGGYTGPGPASQPAGIVHAGEYVMSKAAVDRLGIGYLDQLHNAARGATSASGVSRLVPAGNDNLSAFDRASRAAASLAQALDYAASNSAMFGQHAGFVSKALEMMKVQPRPEGLHWRRTDGNRGSGPQRVELIHHHHVSVDDDGKIKVMVETMGAQAAQAGAAMGAAQVRKALPGMQVNMQKYGRP